MFLRLLSIRTRLIAAFILLLLLLSTVAAIGSLQIARVQFNANDLGTNWLPSTNALASIRATANEARRATLRHVIEESVPGKQAQEEALAKAEKFARPRKEAVAPVKMIVPWPRGSITLAASRPVRKPASAAISQTLR